MTARTSRWLRVAVALVAGVGLGGCHTDMWVQNKIQKPYQGDAFFADGSSARPEVVGVVAHGEYHPDDALYTGMDHGKLATAFPFPITRADLARGQDQFNVFCAPCHGRLGYGNGMIAQRGFAVRIQPGNYHTDRLRRMPVGHFFDVITNGFGMMYGYASRIPDVKDRWRIVAYIRALQLSQHAPLRDVPPGALGAADALQKEAAPTDGATEPGAPNKGQP
ncbi:MAG: c-type cytochrome [Chthonomonadales bacterium]